MRNWQLQEAKARFSELVKQAAKDGPQRITVHGKPTVVLLSVKEYSRLTKPKISFIKFLRHSPLVSIKIDLERNKSLSRDIDL